MEEIIQEVMENEAEDNKIQELYETFPIEEVAGEGGISKLAGAGLFAAGAAAGAVTTKVIVPGVKKAFGWVKGKFTKKGKEEEATKEDESAEEEKEESKDPAEKKPENKHKKGKKR